MASQVLKVFILSWEPCCQRFMNFVCFHATEYFNRQSRVCVCSLWQHISTDSEWLFNLLCSLHLQCAPLCNAWLCSSCGSLKCMRVKKSVCSMYIHHRSVTFLPEQLNLWVKFVHLKVYKNSSTALNR